MEVLFYLNTNYIYIISSHSPHGECGLKCGLRDGPKRITSGHSPHGECGLKYFPAGRPNAPSWSLPTRGVWIEMVLKQH